MVMAAPVDPSVVDDEVMSSALTVGRDLAMSHVEVLSCEMI
jgi:hypothetical protein